MQLEGKNILVTGGAVRIGRAISLHLAQLGAEIALHYGSSTEAAQQTKAEIEDNGGICRLFQADLSDSKETQSLVEQVAEKDPLFALINNAAIFENLGLNNTELADWQRHLDINLTAPFLLSQSFYRKIEQRQADGRIINILDWRALRPAADHLPYTIAKSALAALTRSLALAMAPSVTVNGLALGAILPPSDSGDSSKILENISMQRWAALEEVGQTIEFLLSGPSYITGEIIHLDGGRHLL